MGFRKKYLRRWNPRKKRQKTYYLTRQAAEKLSVNVETLRKWASMGAPHIKSPSNKSYLMFNIEDVQHWLTQQRDEAPNLQSLLGESLIRPRLSITEARPKLQKIKDQLGLTIDEFAELLEIKRNSLLRYLSPNIKLNTIPREVVRKAEFLLQAVEAKPHPFTKKSLEDVRKALVISGGVRWKAKKVLKIGMRTLNNLIDEYDLWEYVKSKDFSENFTKNQIIKALEEANGNKSAAARSLGISRHTLLSLIEKTGLEGQYSFGVSKKELREALRKTGGNRLEAAKILGLAPNSISAAIRRHKLTKEFPLISKISSYEDVKQTLEDAGGVQKIAAEALGISPSYLSRYLKKNKPKEYCICWPHDGLLYVEVPKPIDLLTFLLQLRWRGTPHLRTYQGYVPYWGGGIAFNFYKLLTKGIKPTWYERYNELNDKKYRLAVEQLVEDGIFENSLEAERHHGGYPEECEWVGPKKMRIDLDMIEYVWLHPHMFKNRYQYKKFRDRLKEFLPSDVSIITSNKVPSGGSPCKYILK